MQGDFHIGDRLIQPRINSVQFEEVALHLEPKVMQVLLVLASKPGEVFTREEIRQVVWRDVFVGDDVLMRAVSEIRRVFEDNPQAPHTVQTVPKVGYRLIAPVTIPGGKDAVAAIDSAATFASGPASEAISPAIAPLPRSQTHPLGRRSLLWIGAAASAILLVVIGWAVISNSVHAALPRGSYVSHPLTTYPGSQLQPALSPDGETVAFVWNRTGNQGHQIYVKAVKSGAPVRVTSGDDQEFSPAWSPDGHSLAFIRQSATESMVDVIPALGGSERQVYTFPVNSVGEYGGLTWSPDGGALIFPEQSTPGGTSQLVELSLSSHTVRQLTFPPANWNGDSMPAVSPDGHRLAFARGSEQSTRDIFLMELPNGEPHRITNDDHLILGLVWTQDGSNIVFSSNRGGSLALWRVAPNGGAPERDLAGTDGAYWPTLSKQGDLLSYSHGNASWSIASIPLGTARTQAEINILTSSEQDSAPSISPTANLLAFQSWRSGNQEIWTSAIDGTNPTQLTSQGVSAGSPTWSRDGRLIAFDARPGGFAHIYITDSGGASPRALTSGNFNDVVPGWSADGQTIYFGSNRSGTWQIWRVAADGHGAPQQVTAHGGMVAKPSQDGKWLYFANAGTPGIWRRSLQGDPARGSPEQNVFDGPPADYANYWTVYGDTVYALSNDAGHRSLVRINPATGSVTPVYTMLHDPAPFSGLTISGDGKQLLFSELLEATNNLTLVEHFR
jgi:Tol biopolymer transport system component/DNA-binding winged helix-turn-helix (wHTH) protein